MAQQKISLVKLLKETPVLSLKPEKPKMVIIPSTSTPLEGFRKLADEHILSAPVFDVNKKEFTGFLEMKDLVSFIVFLHDQEHLPKVGSLEDLVKFGCRMFTEPITGITTTYLSRRNRIHTVSDKDSLWDVVVKLSSRDIHRVPVINSNQEIVSIVSQSNINEFLSKHFHDTEHWGSQLIKDIKIGTSPVKTVNRDLPAIEAFKIMDKYKLSGLGIVDNLGTLVGNISNSDLKLFTSNASVQHLQNLDKVSILQYLESIRQVSTEDRNPSISAKPTDNLAFIISKMTAARVHRIFIADDSKGYTPISVISITDILTYIVNEHGK